ncbi:glycoside hydrolase family 125 protein [Sphingomonas sp. H39-1-10]|uniref:glycoside hydrolase family 125 protein n=1 Tax=Sphingomonas pollutisoli TaxID=3030829 RepID=UPI0023B9CBF6|nr:glycoside hydrolase family 125 protein [Sphingomonas pollutisoli]MDF0487880.1 glycoside hydrolase family 125 protein [Sphingomonas pollutisoli]
MAPAPSGPSAWISRRDLLAIGALAPLAPIASAQAADTIRPTRRPPPGERRFISRAVEQEIARVRARIADSEIGWLFENCYPNTLDTTVRPGTVDGKPDTFVITGDIEAMWLRDSSAQLQSYVHLTPRDADLRRLFQGVIQRQARCVLIDPYANAFMADPSAKSNLGAIDDLTEMKPGVAERKWELDSLCYPMRLAHAYWTATRDTTPFDALWSQAMARAVATMRAQQRLHGDGPYRFERVNRHATETLMLKGVGAPTRKVGLIHSMFRPSDDACTLPFLIPSNLFAVAALRMLAQVHAEARHDTAAAADCRALADAVDAALRSHGRMSDGAGGTVWAYEVDGFGNALFMDDANIPSLSALPLLGAARRDDPLYRRTRALAWSARDPYFFTGAAADGIGGPHKGLGMIWPMSIIARAMTSDDDREIRQCLTWLKTTHAGTGFMHESFDRDDPTRYSRPWFAWANGLFGELILDLERRRPALLAQTF